MTIIKVASIIVHPSLSEENYRLHVEHTDFHEDRKLLLLLHGYLGSIDDYYPYFIEFMNKYDIIALDLRGHGKSETPTGEINWTISSLTDDIKQVLDHFDVHNKTMTIIASSLSTAMALEFTNKYPSKVDKLFLISPSSELVLSTWGKIILEIEKLAPKAVFKTLLSIYSNMTLALKISKEKREIFKEGQAKFNRIAYDVHRKIMHETITSWGIEIQNINHPTLIIAGEKDTIVPYNESIQLNEDLENSTIVTLNNTGHHILLSRPEVICELLKTWLEDPNTLLINPNHNEDDILSNNNYSEIAVV